MRKIRLIPRLDIKFPNLIKGIHLEGLRVVGNPAEFAEYYYEQGADELLYMDVVASLYERNTICGLVAKTAEKIFIPMTVGGGVRTLTDASKLLRSGADKIALNTAAVKNPPIIKSIAESFGNQCVVVSIEAKKIGHNKWEVYSDNGRERTGIDVMQWVEDVQKLGVGEILVTSIDQEGTLKGFDIALMKQVCANADVPVIACGGMGALSHIEELVTHTNINAIAIAHVLHYKKNTLGEIRTALQNLGIEVRNI